MTLTDDSEITDDSDSHSEDDTDAMEFDGINTESCFDDNYVHEHKTHIHTILTDFSEMLQAEDFTDYSPFPSKCFALLHLLIHSPRPLVSEHLQIYA